MIIDNDAITYLNELLSLNANGSEQDWEIECSDKNRLKEFIDIYNKNDDFTLTQRYAFISLIIASYDDYLNSKNNASDNIWNEIVTILNRNKGDYNEILSYWAQWNARDIFRVTPLVRLYLH